MVEFFDLMGMIVNKIWSIFVSKDSCSQIELREEANLEENEFFVQ